MRSSAPGAESELELAQELVRRRFALADATVEPVPSLGRNSRIFRVRRGAESFALKRYLSRPDDPRDRLGWETRALELFQRAGLAGVPRVIDVDREGGFALLTWLDGRPVMVPTRRHVDELVAFIDAIRAIGGGPLASEFGGHAASEAVLSGRELCTQIDRRLARLSAAESSFPGLRDLLADIRAHRLSEAIGYAQDRFTGAGLDFERTLDERFRALVPSDIGFHNMLEDDQGGVRFVDFEYFGWDDPAKLCADVVLHPGIPQPVALRAYARDRLIELAWPDPSVGRRLAALLPLFGLRWTLILLNVFVPRPADSQGQVAPAPAPAAQEKQLSEARAMLQLMTDSTLLSTP